MQLMFNYNPTMQISVILLNPCRVTSNGQRQVHFNHDSAYSIDRMIKRNEVFNCKLVDRNKELILTGCIMWTTPEVDKAQVKFSRSTVLQFLTMEGDETIWSELP
jgi:hypothetical protein